MRPNVLIFEGFRPQNVLILLLFSMKRPHLLILLGYFNIMLEECSSSRSRCSVKKVVLKNFTKFTGKFDIGGAQLICRTSEFLKQMLIIVILYLVFELFCSFTSFSLLVLINCGGAKIELKKKWTQKNFWMIDNTALLPVYATFCHFIYTLSFPPSRGKYFLRGPEREYQGRRKLFMVWGELSKNIGHYGWPTTKNKKKTLAKTP